MWLALAFLSAALLGFYDVFKKQALRNNAVIPVLFLNTLFCSLLFLPLIIGSASNLISSSSPFYIPTPDWSVHRFIMIKAVLVLSSWILGYFGIKHLPLTLVGPINATRPVMVLLGALLIFDESLNYLQWIGVGLAIISFFLLSLSGKKEGIRFAHNRWIYCIVVAAVLGAASGLYDKFLLSPSQEGGPGLNRLTVQSWYNFYQCFLMLIIGATLWWPTRSKTTPFHWSTCIIGISLFLSLADFVYFYALSLPDALISVVSMVRRGSVLVSFLFGAIWFREKNLKSKSFDLLLVLLSMLFLWLGSR